MGMKKFICHHCGKESEKYTGHVNRALKMGNNIYCTRVCAGLGRRVERSEEEKKRIKSEYDKQRTDKHELWYLLYRAFEFRVDYEENPEKYKKERERKYEAHLKYLQTDKYKAWKKKYDEKFRARKEFGIYWECAILLKQLEEQLLKIRPDGIKFQMGITNKTQKRKRLWQKTQRQINYLQQI